VNSSQPLHHVSSEAGVGVVETEPVVDRGSHDSLGTAPRLSEWEWMNLDDAARIMVQDAILEFEAIQARSDALVARLTSPSLGRLALSAWQARSLATLPWLPLVTSHPPRATPSSADPSAGAAHPFGAASLHLDRASHDGGSRGAPADSVKQQRDLPTGAAAAAAHEFVAHSTFRGEPVAGVEAVASYILSLREAGQGASEEGTSTSGELQRLATGAGSRESSGGMGDAASRVPLPECVAVLRCAPSASTTHSVESSHAQHLRSLEAGDQAAGLRSRSPGPLPSWAAPEASLDKTSALAQPVSSGGGQWHDHPENSTVDAGSRSAADGGDDAHHSAGDATATGPGDADASVHESGALHVDGGDSLLFYGDDMVLGLKAGSDALSPHPLSGPGTPLPALPAPPTSLEPGLPSFAPHEKSIETWEGLTQPGSTTVVEHGSEPGAPPAAMSRRIGAKDAPRSRFPSPARIAAARTAAVATLAQQAALRWCDVVEAALRQRQSVDLRQHTSSCGAVDRGGEGVGSACGQVGDANETPALFRYVWDIVTAFVLCGRVAPGRFVPGLRQSKVLDTPDAVAGAVGMEVALRVRRWQQLRRTFSSNGLLWLFDALPEHEIEDYVYVAWGVLCLGCITPRGVLTTRFPATRAGTRRQVSWNGHVRDLRVRMIVRRPCWPVWNEALQHTAPAVHHGTRTLARRSTLSLTHPAPCLRIMRERRQARANFGPSRVTSPAAMCATPKGWPGAGVSCRAVSRTPRRIHPHSTAFAPVIRGQPSSLFSLGACGMLSGARM